jgi:hypothetical protein
MRTLGTRRVALLIGALLAPIAADVARADPLPARAREVVDYDIQVALDPVTKRLTGRQRVTWRNPSADTVPDLWFHLYLNAFRNTRSTFWKESGGESRGFAIDDRDGWGWIDVTSLTLADGADLTPALRFESPDDGNSDDRTVARVMLPKPIAPGAAVTLDIVFTAQLPRVFARTGYVRDYALVGQWFPKLGVYEPAGRRGRATGGWNCHQFHATSEFYADFGHYKVAMTVPSRFVLGATGTRLSRSDHGNGTTTYVHEQSNVHDFAWTVDPQFVEVRRRFDPAREVSEAEARAVADLLDRPIEEVRLTSVDVILLMQPEHLAQTERYLRAAMLAIKWFGLWYGRYPYQTLTIVDPAPGAGGSGGMEYPTFITAGTHALLSYWPFDAIRAPEEVTVHEFGHQFWQGLVANNEFEEAWLDEGFNSYSTGKIMEIGYGRDATVAAFLGLRLNEIDSIRLQNNPNRAFDAIRQSAWAYDGSGAYGFNAYAKPELVLRTLESYIGERTVARIMRTYHERWRFGHPSSDDFYAVASEVSGRDLRPLLVQLAETGALLDYEVRGVRSVRQRRGLGYFDAPDGQKRLVSAAEEERDPRSGVLTGADAGRPYETAVTVRRRGDIVLPVTIAFKFEGRPAERLVWDGAARWKRFDFTRPERLEWVDIDPDRTQVLDVDWLNNARRVEAQPRAAAWLTARWLLVVQQFLSWVAL